jgi:hypothetical protein
MHSLTNNTKGRPEPYHVRNQGRKHLQYESDPYFILSMLGISLLSAFSTMT